MQDDPQQATPPAANLLPILGSAPANPAWAKDLRKLYNAVVEEQLPDSFLALLAKLDAAE